MKRLAFSLLFSFLTSCMTNYPLTAFYVKNNTNKTVNFKASVIKHGPLGLFEMTLPFTILPNDNILVRKVNFKKDIPPNEWFTSFIIFPVDSFTLNDPKEDGNWIKSTDTKGRPVYTFKVAK